MSVHIGEVWSDVPPLPNVRAGRADLYLRFPTIRSAQRVREQLLVLGHDVSSRDDPYVLMAPGLEPLSAIREMIKFLTPPERRDTLALLRPPGTAPESIDLFFALSVDALHNRLAATWLLEMLREGKLTSVFQRIVDARDTSRLKGYEVLVRGWRDGEEVDARRMFDVAESAYLMSQLDARAMQTALQTAANVGVETTLFLNCSPAHMHDPHTRVAEIALSVHRLGLHPARIVLEVIETERHDREHLREFMLACRRHGFRVALDDLGSGYSSITILAELRPDMLKFDRDLITAVNVDPYRALIVNRLLDAARILGLPTIVEGVETSGEVAWAAANGATYVQGNFIAKPAPRPE